MAAAAGAPAGSFPANWLWGNSRVAAVSACQLSPAARASEKEASAAAELGASGGGGGGYRGGDGGDVTDFEILGRIDPEGFGGGGGGSYIDPAFTNVVGEDGANFGNGMVEINSTVIPYTGGIYDYIVPATGPYNILAFGAQGGASYSPPGLRAEVGGYVTLDKGTVLAIVVGAPGGRLGSQVGLRAGAEAVALSGRPARPSQNLRPGR